MAEPGAPPPEPPITEASPEAVAAANAATPDENSVRVYDRNNESHYVTPDQALSGIRQGVYAMADGDKITIIDSSNKKRVIDGSESVTAARSPGTRGLGINEYLEGERKKAYDTPSDKAAAFSAGTLNMLGLGFGNAGMVGLAGAIGGDTARANTARDIANYRKYLPGYFAAGEATGMAAPLLLSMGASSGVQGAGMAGRLASAVNLPRGLAAASEAVGGAVTRGLGGGLLARGVGAAAGGALELGVYGAGEGLSRAMVERPDLTAEQALAALGGGFAHGAATGAAFGGVMGFGGGLLRAGASKASGAASSAWGRFARAGEEAGVTEASIAAGTAKESAVEKYISIVSKGDAKEAEALREAWRDRQRLIGKADETLEGAQRTLRKDVDELLSAERRLTEEAQGKLKIEQVKKSIQTGNEGATLEHVQGQLDTVRGRISEMLGDAGAYGNRAQLKEAQSIVDSVEKRISHAVGTDAQNAVMFSELDFLKRRLGKFARPGQMVGADSATAGAMRELYEGLRSGLEDVGLWGKAAEQQSVINAAWAKQLESKGRFQSDFATVVGRDEIDPWVSKFASDPAKLSGYVNSFGRAANDLRHETLAAHVANTRALAEAIGKQYELTPAKAAEVARAKAAAESFQKTIAGVEKEVGATNRLKRLQEEEKAHAIGGLTGLAVDVVSRPVATMARVAELEAMAAKVQKKMGDAVTGYFGTAKQVAKDAAAKVAGAARAAGAVGERAVKAGVIEADLANERAKAAKHPIEKRFGSDRDRILSAKASLPQQQQQFAQQMQGAPAPFVQQALAAQQRAVDYLTSQIPKAPQAMSTLQPHLDKSTPPPAEMAKFLRAVQAVEDPSSVLASLQKGDISSEQVDALKAVYPAMYAQLQKQIVTAVAEMGDKPLPYAKAQALSELFGVPLHPAMQPEFIAAQQQALAQVSSPTPQPPRPHKPSSLAKNYQLNSEEV